MSDELRLTMPEPGWTTPAKVTRVLDGDTVEVVIERRLRVRILDLWCYEMDEPGGITARQFVVNQIAGDRPVLLEVPSDIDLREVFSFGRVLGRIWLADTRQELAELVIDAGLGTREKPSAGQ